MRLRSILAIVVLTGSWVVLSANESLACSCAVPEPRDALADADAAFVGSLIDRSDSGPTNTFWGDDVATFRFVVSDDLKGNLGDEIDVVSGAGDGGTCGLDVSENARVAYLLDLVDHNIWTASLCSSMDPDVLLRAAAPLPEPDGRGPVRLIVGGSLGEVRVMSLDHRGRTLAYGYGTGDVYDLDVCPGGERMVESVADGSVGSLVVRDIATLAIVREIGIVETKFPSIYEVACLDGRGDRLVALDDVAATVRVHVVDGRRAEIVFEARGRSWGSDLASGYAELTLQDGTFGRVDVVTGSFEAIVELPDHADAGRLSPDGRWVAAVRYGGARPGEPPSDIVLIPADGGEIVTHDLVSWNDGGRLEWLDDDRLLFLPAGEDTNRVAFYEVPSFAEVVGADGWYDVEATFSEGVLYGVSGDGRISAVELGVDASTRLLRQIDGALYAIASVGGDFEAEPSPAPSTAPARPVQPWPTSGRSSSTATTVMWFVLGAIVVSGVAVALRRT